MAMHRWWLALIAVLLTPWVGPHIDGYIPVGWVLIRATSEAPDPGFWVIAGAALALGYLAWLLLLSGFGAWLSHRRRGRENPDGDA